MVKITVNSPESFEQALRKFKQTVAKEGILRDYKIKSHFENSRDRKSVV
jgi:ribosomal protein S21